MLFVMDSLYTGGAEYSTLQWASWLSKRTGWDISMVCLRERKPSFDPGKFGLVDRIKFLKGPAILWWWELVKVMRHERPDIVHSVLLKSNFNCRWTSLFVKALYIESMVNRTYDPVRYQDRRVSSWLLECIRWMDRWSQAWGVDAFHSVTSDIGRHFGERTGVPKHKIAVIPRGREENSYRRSSQVRSELREQLGAGEDQVVFINVARHEYQKGQRFLIEAFAQAARGIDAVLWIAGREGKETPDLESLLKEADIASRVRLLGHRDDIQQLLCASDIFVLPSLFEGIAGVLIEAEAAGLPIIASDLEGVREVVEPEKNSWLVPPGEIRPLAERMHALALQKDYRFKMGQSSYEIFSARFGLSGIHMRMEAFYLDQLKRKE